MVCREVFHNALGSGFSWKGMNRGTILLYGHTHNSAEDVYFQKCLAGMEENDCRHVGDKPIQAYNVGCMKPWIDYEPRSLKEIAGDCRI